MEKKIDNLIIDDDSVKYLPKSDRKVFINKCIREHVNNEQTVMHYSPTTVYVDPNTFNHEDTTASEKDNSEIMAPLSMEHEEVKHNNILKRILSWIKRAISIQNSDIRSLLVVLPDGDTSIVIFL